MKSVFKKLDDCANARRYLTSQLHQGTSLAKAFLDSGKWQLGSIYIALPQDIDANGITNFSDEMFGLDRGPMIDLLEDLVSKFLATTRGELLFQDSLTKPSDPVAARLPEVLENMVFYGDEVYWNLRNFSERARIDRIVNCASFWPYSGFFHPFKDDAAAPSGFSNQDISRIALEVVGVVVDAFDAASFIVWWQESYPFPLNSVRDHSMSK